MKIMKKQLLEGQIIPKFYGIAYWDFKTFTCYAYPIPINILVRLWKIILTELRYGILPHRRERDLIAAYHRGMHDGRVCVMKMVDQKIMQDLRTDAVMRFINEGFNQEQ